jgi:hypothetical protein
MPVRPPIPVERTGINLGQRIPAGRDPQPAGRSRLEDKIVLARISAHRTTVLTDQKRKTQNAKRTHVPLTGVTDQMVFPPVMTRSTSATPFCPDS